MFLRMNIVIPLSNLNAPELKFIKKLFWIKLDPTTHIFDCTKIAILSSKCIQDLSCYMHVL